MWKKQVKYATYKPPKSFLNSVFAWITITDKDKIFIDCQYKAYEAEK